MRFIDDNENDIFYSIFIEDIEAFSDHFRKLDLVKRKSHYDYKFTTNNILHIAIMNNSIEIVKTIFEIEPESLTCILPAHPRHQIIRELQEIQDKVILFYRSIKKLKLKF